MNAAPDHRVDWIPLAALAAMGTAINITITTDRQASSTKLTLRFVTLFYPPSLHSRYSTIFRYLPPNIPLEQPFSVPSLSPPLSSVFFPSLTIHNHARFASSLA
jgi:hypothetical protein